MEMAVKPYTLGLNERVLFIKNKSHSFYPVVYSWQTPALIVARFANGVDVSVLSLQVAYLRYPKYIRWGAVILARKEKILINMVEKHSIKEIP